MCFPSLVGIWRAKTCHQWPVSILIQGCHPRESSALRFRHRQLEMINLGYVRRMRLLRVGCQNRSSAKRPLGRRTDESPRLRASASVLLPSRPSRLLISGREHTSSPYWPPAPQRQRRLSNGIRMDDGARVKFGALKAGRPGLPRITTCSSPSPTDIT